MDRRKAKRLIKRSEKREKTPDDGYVPIVAGDETFSFDSIDTGENPGQEEINERFLHTLMTHELPPDQIYVYTAMRNKRCQFMAIQGKAERTIKLGPSLLMLKNTLNVDLSKYGKGLVKVHFYDEF